MCQFQRSSSPSCCWSAFWVNPCILLTQVRKAKSVAIATLIFAILSLLGFLVPFYFPGSGGLLSIIGTSIILCCASNGAGGYMACAVLSIISAVIHLFGCALYVWYYVTVVVAFSGVGVGAAVAAWLAPIFIPIMIITGVAGVLEIILAVYCCKAHSALQTVLPHSQAKPPAA